MSDAWTPSDVRRRADRVLLQELLPEIARLPTARTSWLESLPAQSLRTSQLTASPSGRVDWVRTRMGGWPPERFSTTQRRRAPAEILVALLGWCAYELRRLASSAEGVVPGICEPIQGQLSAMQEAVARLGLTDGAAVPTRTETAGASRAGVPWAGLAAIADSLRMAKRASSTLSRLALVPDDDLRWRLFHIGCLGLVLHRAKQLGWTATSLRPLGIGSGPSYKLEKDGRAPRDLWFEAGGMWSYYGVKSPYSVLTAGVSGRAQPLGADLAMREHDGTILLVECKYSSDVSYVTRNGYLQALTYLAEAQPRVAFSRCQLHRGSCVGGCGEPSSATPHGERRADGPRGSCRAS